MTEPSRKRRRGNSVVQSVEDIVNEVAALRKEIERVRNDSERLMKDNERLITENTRLQGDVSEMKKLDTIRNKEVWDVKKEKKELEKEKKELVKRARNRDIDVYERDDFIEELQEKRKVYETEREAAEITDTPGTRAIQPSQSMPDGEEAPANSQAKDPLVQNGYQYDLISSIDHVADEAEIQEQMRADVTEVPGIRHRNLAIKDFHESFNNEEWPYYMREQVYGRSRRELILVIQAAIGMAFRQPRCEPQQNFKYVFGSYWMEDTNVSNFGQFCTHSSLIVVSALRMHTQGHVDLCVFSNRAPNAR